MLRTAMTYKANATISGGSKSGSYSSSVSYLNKEGILRNTDHESYNIRLKSDYSFFDNRLTIGESMIVNLTKVVDTFIRIPCSISFSSRQ